MANLYPALTQFIFRPGASSGTRFDAGVPVYNDFAELYADLIAVNANQGCVILFDMNGVASCDIPAGTYDMTNTAWVGAGGFGPGIRGELAIVHILSGVTVNNLACIEKINLNNNAATDPIVVSGNFILRDCQISRGVSQTEIFAVTGTSQATFYLFNSSFGLVNRTVLNMASTGTVTVRALERSNVTNDFVSGTTGTVTLNYSITAGVGTPSFASYSGTTNLTPGDGFRTHTMDREIPVTGQGGNTRLADMRPGDRIRIEAIRLYALTAPTTSGTYTLAVAGNGNNLLSTATFDLTSLVSDTYTALTLTATADDLDINNQQLIRFTFASDNVDLAGSGILVVVEYTYR